MCHGLAHSAGADHRSGRRVRRRRRRGPHDPAPAGRAGLRPGRGGAAAGAPADAAAARPDVAGLTVAPGLIDAHVHVKAWTADLAAVPRHPPSYTALRAAEVLAGMLRRGFTTVRDVGGADAGLARAVAGGAGRRPAAALLRARAQPDRRPRRHPRRGGAVLVRRRGEPVPGRRRRGRAAPGLPGRAAAGGALPQGDGLRRDQLADRPAGLPAVRHRRAGRRGRGGDERRPVRDRPRVHVGIDPAGRRSRLPFVEHANLMDAATADLLAEKGMFVVGTLATYEALAVRGREEGMPADQLAKLQRVRDAGLKSLELASAAGVRLVYGTDLLGAMHDAQLTEFSLRAQAQPVADVLRAATVTAAALLGEDDLGASDPAPGPTCCCSTATRWPTSPC